MAELNQLEEKLGYHFNDKHLLELAITHRSKNRSTNNERLEFLGDSIVNHIIAVTVFKRFPFATEGHLTRLRSQMVKGATLAVVAKSLSLDEFMIVGAGERKSGGYRRESTLADALEAILAAIYLDSGVTACEERVAVWFDHLLNELDPNKINKDNKTLLQELMQKNGEQLPSYTLLKQTGKDHNPKFMVRCKIRDGDIFADAIGSSQRKAQQIAAEMVLLQLNAPKDNIVEFPNDCS